MGRKCVRPFEPIDKEERLQKCFKTIRMATGMNSGDLAEKLGCSRQLINGIEAGHNNVTYMTFLGMEGIVLNSHSSLLQDLWDILVDNDSYTEDLREFACSWGTVIAGALAHGAITQSEADSKWSVVISEL